MVDDPSPCNGASCHCLGEESLCPIFREAPRLESSRHVTSLAPLLVRFAPVPDTFFFFAEHLLVKRVDPQRLAAAYFQSWVAVVVSGSVPEERGQILGVRWGGAGQIEIGDCAEPQRWFRGA